MHEGRRYVASPIAPPTAAPESNPIPAPFQPCRCTPALSSSRAIPADGKVIDEPLASPIRTLSFDAASSVPTNGSDDGTVTRTRDPGARSTDARDVVCAAASPQMQVAKAKPIATGVRAPTHLRLNAA